MRGGFPQRADRCGLSLTREGPCRGLSVKMVAALEPHEERCTEWCLPVSASVLPMRSRRLCRKTISVARANTLPSRQRGPRHSGHTPATPKSRGCTPHPRIPPMSNRPWWPCAGLPTAMDASAWKNADRICPLIMQKCRSEGCLPGRYAHGCTRCVPCTMPTIPHFLV